MAESCSSRCRLSLLCQEYLQLKQQVTELEQYLTQIHALKETLLALERRITNAEQAMALIQQGYINLPKCEKRAQTIDQSFTELSTTLHTINIETQPLMLRELDNLSEKIEDQTVKLGELEMLNILQDMDINDRKQQIDSLELRNENGHLDMVLDIHEMQTKAAMHGAWNVNSPYFYTGKYGQVGYKMETVVCYHSNAMAINEGPVLSLGLVIKKGEYDALLPWPFQQAVSFEITPFHRIRPRPVWEVEFDLQPHSARPELQRPSKHSTGNNAIWTKNRVYLRDIASFIKDDGQIHVQVRVDKNVHTLI